jgi:hypothetical protein
MFQADVGSGSSRGRAFRLERRGGGAVLAKHYDATLKDLLEADPSAEGWANGSKPRQSPTAQPDSSPQPRS